MATTQYIGARYVPIFYTNPDDNSNNWKSGVVYDPLTVVTDLNQSYTSKIPVPASVGRPSENPTYWILTGAYSAQVEQYRQEVAEYADDLSALGTEVSNIQTDVESIARGKKYLLIGDSLGLGISVINNTAVTTKGWCGYFIDAVGADKAVMVSINGGGFGEPSPYNWLEQLRNASWDNFNDSDFTDVIILGGSNDLDNTPSEINLAISAMVSYIRSRFINVSRIAVGALCEPRLAKRVHERYTECRHYGCEYIGDLERLLCDASKYDPTKHTHLSESGYAYYAPWIVSAAISGHCEYNFRFYCEATKVWNAVTLTGPNPYFVYSINQDQTVINVRTDDRSDTLTCTGSINWVHVGTGANYQHPNKLFEDQTDACYVTDASGNNPERTFGIWYSNDYTKSLPYLMTFYSYRYMDHNSIYVSPLLDASGVVNLDINSSGNMILN